MHSDVETAQNFHLLFLQCQVKIQCPSIRLGALLADHTREKRKGEKGTRNWQKKLEKRNISDDSS